LNRDGALSMWSSGKKKRPFAFKEDFLYGR